jgi:hypothetical protein
MVREDLETFGVFRIYCFLLEQVMAGKKDPSIYDDRSNIGSSEELDEYGVWVKSEPQDLSSAMPGMEELPDFGDGIAGTDLPDFGDDGDDTETSVEASDFAPEVEFEEIPEDSDLPDGQNPTEVDKDGFTEVSVNDFLDEEEMDLANSSIDIGDLDNISDFPEEVPEILPAANRAPAAVSSGASGSELSNQLLMKIAEELSSIKQELSSLKTELSLVRNTQTESQDVHGAAGGGFFDEEDDEKIALTGDELDNILNTANFTEEAGSGENIEDDVGAFEGPDGTGGTENDLPLSAKPDIIGDTEIPPVQEETPEFDVAFDDTRPSDDFRPESVEEIADDFDISLDLTKDLIEGTDIEDDAVEIPFSDSDDGLGSLREVGVKPMTQIDGDTRYLEEDPLASIPDDGQIDLSSAVIDEPDLSAGITENPIEDPSIENISIDIDMEEPEIPGIENGDFNLESEKTMEIPVMDESLADDFFPVSDSASTGTVETPVEEADAFAAEPSPAGEPDDFGVEFPADDEPAAFAAAPPAAGEPDDFGVEFPADDEPGVFPPTESVLSQENGIPSSLKQELKTVLSYLDQLLESLPEDKIEEFAKSEYFDTYKKLFEELGLV